MVKTKNGRSGKKKKANSLFKDTGNPSSAYISSRIQKDYAYIEGFKMAAQILAKNCTTSYDRNTLIYPIVFSYRHHIELILKSTFTSLNFYITGTFLAQCNKSTKEMITRNHKLKPIWEAIKKLREQLDKDDREYIFDPKYDLKKVDNVIKDFSTVDPESFSFRYSFDKKFQPTIPLDLEWADPENFVSLMNEASKIVEAIHNMTAIARQQRDDIV
jgi:hypothetical protein